MSLQFRARFIDPDNTTEERPQQIVSSDMDAINAWADKMLNQSSAGPNSFVAFFETSERQIGFKKKPRQESAE